MLPGLTGMVGFSGTAAVVTDPHFASTVLLMACDGTNGSTTFSDESAVARGNASFSGNPIIATNHKKFGTGSIRCDGVGDNIIWSDSADWNFTGDFTIDAWASFDAANLTQEQNLIAQFESSGNQRAFTLRFRGDMATDRLEFIGSSDGATAGLTVPFNWTPTADQFYLISVDRSGNVFRTYIDGAMVAKVTQAFAFHNSTAALRLGSRSSGGPAAEFRGNLDEVRITKGVARYASDSGFTLPSSAWPRS